MTDPQKSNQTQQGIISNGIAQQSGGSGGIRLYWLINETPSDGGVLQLTTEPSYGEIKTLWLGSRASFEFKCPGGGYSWQACASEAERVPVIAEENELRIVVRLRPIESPTTTIHYTLEGHPLSFEVVVQKPSTKVTLSEVKDAFPGTAGIFLFKTPDPLVPSGSGQSVPGYHWNVILDSFGIVPSYEDGKIFAQVKMKAAPKCVVEYQLEDGSSSYVRIQKPSRQVVLSDIKAFSPNPNGVFLFKTVEADSFVWAVWVDESAPVPSHSQDLITCKVKPYGRFALK